MSEIDPRLPAEAYMAHSEWVRRLARRLLDDAGAADDVAQETWIAFLRQPLGTVRDLRGWLHGVTRRLALKSARERGTRRLQRADVEKELIAPSADDVLEIELVRKQVIESVLALEEPYRSTVLLHFYEGHSSEDIARRLGLPSSTVRTRLQRGLAKLREKLEAQDVHGENGLRSALLLVTRTSVPPVAAGKGAVLAASALAKSSLIGALLIGVAVLCWLVFYVTTPIADRSATKWASSADSRSSPETTPMAPARTSGSELDRAALPVDSASDSRWRLAIHRDIGSLAGMVVREDRGLPVAGASVRITTSTGPVARNMSLVEDRAPILRSLVTGVDGSFRFDDLPTGPYALHAEMGSDLRADLIVAATDDSVPMLVTLASQLDERARIDALDVRTIDGSGARVANADIEFTFRSGDGNQQTRRLRSDERGEAHCDQLDLRRGLLFAKTTDGRVGQALVTAGADEHARWLLYRSADPKSAPEYEVILEEPGAIAGVVQDGPSIVVHAWFGATIGVLPHDARATTGPEGSFRLDALPAGKYMLTVDAPAGFRADLPEWGWTGGPHANEFFPRVVQVEAGATTTIRVPIVTSAAVHGRVTQADGKTPIAGAEVNTWIVRENFGDPGGLKRGSRYSWSMYSSVPIDQWLSTDWQRTVTDADGAYSFTGLDEKMGWALEVLARDRERDFVGHLALETGKTLEIEHHLECGGGIQGIGWRSATIGFQREGERDCRETVSLSNDFESTFTVTGLRPGRYTICALHWSDLDRQAPITTVDVLPGELTWIDLRNKAPNSASVRISSSGKPAAGAFVRLRCPDEFVQSTCDARGRCTFHLPFSSRDPAVLDVTQFGGSDPVKTRFIVPDLLDGTPGRDVELSLPEGALDVNVRNERGAPVSARVIAEPVSSWNEGTDVVAPLTFTLNAVRDTDQSGTARFTGLTPGPIKVRVIGGEGWMIPPVPTEIVVGERKEVNLVEPSTGSLTVHALNPHGQPMRRVRVDVARKSDSVMIASFRLTDDTGTVTFPAVPSGQVVVNASNDLRDLSATGYGTGAGIVEAGATATITVRLQ